MEKQRALRGGGRDLKKRLLCILLCLGLLGAGLFLERRPDLIPAGVRDALAPPQAPSFSLDALPEYSGQAAVILNENLPSFPEEDKTSAAFESYSPLDTLGRCGPAYANVCRETMPTGDREPIGMVRPSGWQFSKYDFVDGNYLFNRCHLIGYQLTGENANERNLVTGTRYLNVQGMLPFENQVADYVRETGNHVLYRVTPIFEGDDLVCSGVELEGWSVEDGGEGVCFHAYAYNVQPGVGIDYATGDNWPEGGDRPAESPNGETSYVLNVNSNRFHRPDCSGVASISEKNRRDYTGSRDALIGQGYLPCGSCNP